VQRKEEAMQIIGTTLVLVFVVGTLVAVGYALFRMSPWATHTDQFRDPKTGKRIGEAPRLD
jgi:hypothetical protein